MKPNTEDNQVNKKSIDVPFMAECLTRNHHPEYLFWVGCAGAFDERYKKVTRAFAKILTHTNTDYAILGAEETCTGDPARRAGNEMLFQLQAMKVIGTFQRYQIKKIITCCPHCYNTFKNEYPDLGGHYEVIHHTIFIQNMIKSGMIKPDENKNSGEVITYHDPCYLGRANNIYSAPREIIQATGAKTVELPRNRSRALCCGAGGAQMFKDSEPGNTEIYNERTREILSTTASIVATACPFCMTMITDGIKYQTEKEDIQNKDIAELIAESLHL